MHWEDSSHSSLHTARLGTIPGELAKDVSVSESQALSAIVSGTAAVVAGGGAVVAGGAAVVAGGAAVVAGGAAVVTGGPAVVADLINETAGDEALVFVQSVPK